MKRNVCILFFLLSPILCLAQNQAQRPKIGLALSGGGAKGLAHIGLLMAIDSVGINIDYLAGTSMGSIVGGLYASGYSGKEIAEIAKKVNWEKTLSNKPDFEEIIIPYKEENRQFIEVPIINKKIMIGTGVLESNELWLWLYEKFAAYNQHSDFTNMPIPFRCVATRLDTGEMIVLKEGNVINAIRASMAIPTVFTPVTIDDIHLVDGGLVRNFPVSEVIDMGASLVIGSSVANEALSSENIDNPLKIFSQIAFYSDQRDFKNQRALTDIYVDYPIEPYYAGSFSAAGDILQLGIKKGIEMIPVLQNFKDSLDQIYGYEPFKKATSRHLEKIKLKQIETLGLSPGTWYLYNRKIGLWGNRNYSITQLSDKLRGIYTSGNFKKINYSFEPNIDSTYNLKLSLQKDSKTHFRSGISYNEDMGLGLKAGIAWDETLNLFSTTSAAVSLGENPKILLRNIHFLGTGRNLFFETSLAGEITKKTYYNNQLATAGTFRQNNLRTEINLAKLIDKNFQIGIGGGWEITNYNPEIQTEERPRGEYNFLNTYVRLKFNNQNAAFNPIRGSQINFETGLTFKPHSRFNFKNDGSKTPTTLELETNNITTLRFYSSHYKTVGSETLYGVFNAGIHWGNHLPYVYNFAVGGSSIATRNQIVFPSFRLNGISTSSAASSQLGVRHNFTSKFSTALGANLLLYDFMKDNFKPENQTKNFTWGINLTGSYDFFLGPIEITLMYSEINKKLTPTFNLGYSMNISK